MKLRIAGLAPAAIDPLVRIGTAEMIERCFACWQAGRGLGVLGQMVKQGGPSVADLQPGLAVVLRRPDVLEQADAWQHAREYRRS